MKVTKCLYCENRSLIHVTLRSDDMNIIRCKRCSVMMVEEIKDNTEELYTSDYFQKPEDTKFGYTSYLSAPVANLIGKYAFARLFQKNAGSHLDLGCADGSLMEIFVENGFESHGLEISIDAVTIANEKGLNAQYSNLHSFPARMRNIDVITAFDLLEHVDLPGATLKEIYNALSDDGYFVFSTLCVKNYDPSDYWFNNSLEHYIYYDDDSLRYILSEVFGKDNFYYAEIVNNGISEFWGVAKKGARIHGEKRVINSIDTGNFADLTPEEAYLATLFLNQSSRFGQSGDIIDTFGPSWVPQTRMLANFYKLYFSGGFERIMNEIFPNRHLIPSKESVFWQALVDVVDRMSIIRTEQVNAEKDALITGLQDSLFDRQTEISDLKNSFIISKAIRARAVAGNLRQRLLLAGPSLRSVMWRIRVVVAPLVPKSLRLQLKSNYKIIRNGRDVRPEIVQVKNKKWDPTSPAVSIIIPYFNAGATVTQTLRSVYAQTFRNFEVILVDDASDDIDTDSVLDQIGESFPAVKIIRKNKNEGVAEARNTGLENALGNYLVCLDSDDWIEPMYLEKSLLILETSPEVDIVTPYTELFGVKSKIPEYAPDGVVKYVPYDARQLIDNNMVIHAAITRRALWDSGCRYVAGIGYEDWEYWVSAAEKGFFGRTIEEVLFHYRTSISSRFMEDRNKHRSNVEAINKLHKNYREKILKIIRTKKKTQRIIEPKSAFINMKNKENYIKRENRMPKVLITMPWMTFGGAETLIYNFSKELSTSFDITFMTGLKSDHEWEWRFKEITGNIYHLANLFDNQRLYLEFVSSYIDTSDIGILHIVHNGFMFEMLEDLKFRHPKLKIIVTMFNDRVEYYEQSIRHSASIDVFTTDNSKVEIGYVRALPAGTQVVRIPNGIDSTTKFSPKRYQSTEVAKKLGIDRKKLAVYFFGRLSPEKNPDVFVDVARELEPHTKDTAHFYIIGDGPMKKDIKKKIGTLSNITYLGYQDNIPEYLSVADIFILPSSIEGFPLSLLEAMAMNVAVIASDVGAVSDVIDSGENGFVIKPGSSIEAAKIVQLLIKDKKLLDKVKKNARFTVEHKYSNLILGKNYKKLYLGLLK